MCLGSCIKKLSFILVMTLPQFSFAVQPAPENITYTIPASPAMTETPAATLAYQSLRPVWAIAHRVLTRSAVDAALAHKVNALEIDVRWESAGPWWAAHDAGPLGRKEKLADLFKYIANRKKEGAIISFVWLDIKSPDGCDNELGKGRQNMQECKIGALTKLARELLESAGIRVLYGFDAEDNTGMKSGFAKVASTLNDMEGIAVQAGTWTSNLDKAFRLLNVHRIPLSSRVLDRGIFNPEMDLTNSIIDDLKKIAIWRDKGEVTRGFGWTAVSVKHVNAILDAGADGVIIGNAARDYTDDASNRELADAVRVYANTHNLRIALKDDIPFGGGPTLSRGNTRLRSLKTLECLSVNIHNNAIMADCGKSGTWEKIVKDNGRFLLKSSVNGLCLTEWDGQLSVKIGCDSPQGKSYQSWQWVGKYLVNGKHYLNGASLIDNIATTNAYQSEWEWH